MENRGKGERFLEIGGGGGRGVEGGLIDDFGFWILDFGVVGTIPPWLSVDFSGWGCAIREEEDLASGGRRCSGRRAGGVG